MIAPFCHYLLHLFFPSTEAELTTVLKATTIIPCHAWHQDLAYSILLCLHAKLLCNFFLVSLSLLLLFGTECAQIKSGGKGTEEQRLDCFHPCGFACRSEQRRFLPSSDNKRASQSTIGVHASRGCKKRAKRSQNKQHHSNNAHPCRHSQHLPSTSNIVLSALWADSSLFVTRAQSRFPRSFFLAALKLCTCQLLNLAPVQMPTGPG